MEPSGIRAYVGLLRSSPDAEPAFAELEAGIRDIQRLLDRPAPPSQRAAAAQAELVSLCERVADLLLDTTTFDEETDEGVDRARQQILQCLESWCTDRLHDSVIGVLRGELHADVDALRVSLSAAAASGKRAGDLGVKRLFDVDFAPAVARLAEIAALRTPLEKLHCVRDASMLVHKCVETALEASGTDLADVEMGADDTLPILAWLILQIHTTAAAAATTSPPAAAVSAASPGGKGSGASAATSPAGASAKGAASSSSPSSSAASPAFCQTASELPLHFAFIQRFHVPGSGELEMSLLGYRLANLEQALNLFREGERG
jgi:hypothetical protein